MLRFLLLLAVAFAAACDTGPVPEELYYGPNKRRLGPRPFPPGPEGPWAEVNSRGETRDDGFLFDRGRLCRFDLDEVAYNQFTIDCACDGTYKFRSGYLELSSEESPAPLYIAYELSDADTRLRLVIVQEFIQGLRTDWVGETVETARPPIAFTVEDCTRLRFRNDDVPRPGR